MFQFPAFAPPGYGFTPAVTGYDPCRVAPFGNLRIKGCLRLPEAYRSLPRPSSLPGAKASALRPFMLDFYFRLPAKEKPESYTETHAAEIPARSPPVRRPASRRHEHPRLVTSRFACQRSVGEPTSPPLTTGKKPVTKTTHRPPLRHPPTQSARPNPQNIFYPYTVPGPGTKFRWPGVNPARPPRLSRERRDPLPG